MPLVNPLPFQDLHGDIGGADFAEQFDRSGPNFHNGNPTVRRLSGAEWSVDTALKALLEVAES